MSLADEISVDDEHNIVTIFGVKFSADLLRAMTEPTPDGQWFRIIKLSNDVMHVHTRYDS